MHFAGCAPVAGWGATDQHPFSRINLKNDLSAKIRDIRGYLIVAVYRPSTKFTVICVSTSITSPFRM